MMTEINPEQAVGKKFKRLCSSWTNHQAVIVFDDDTFFTIVGGKDYDGEVSIVSARLDVNSFGDNLLVEAGVFNEEGIERVRAKRHAEFKAQQQAEDRDTYERLRKKFEKEK